MKDGQWHSYQILISTSVNGIFLSHAPEIDKTTFREENDVPTRCHCVAIYLRFDVDCLFSVCFQPGYIYLNIEMPDTI